MELLRRTRAGREPAPGGKAAICAVNPPRTSAGGRNYVFTSAPIGGNKGVRGGFAPAHAYIPELLPDVLDGTIQPGKVFDLELPLAQVADAYRAMGDRRAVKVLLRP